MDYHGTAIFTVDMFIIIATIIGWIILMFSFKKLMNRLQKNLDMLVEIKEDVKVLKTEIKNNKDNI
jgi:hypothetical protein